MPLNDKLPSQKCVGRMGQADSRRNHTSTPCVRSPLSAQTFSGHARVDRTRKRTAAICEISTMMNMSALSDSMHEFFDEWNIPSSARRTRGSAPSSEIPTSTPEHGRPRHPVHPRPRGKGLDTCPGTSWARALQHDHRHLPQTDLNSTARTGSP